MKKSKHFLNVTILLIAALALSGCVLMGIDDSDEECKKGKRDLIERTFKPTVTVIYSDNMPFAGKITFSIHKVYCDGRFNGKYVEKGESNINGVWNVGYTYTYKFEHPMDEVLVKIDITGVDGGGLELTDTETYTYDYEDVENQSEIHMKDDYVIQLTWPSTQ